MFSFSGEVPGSWWWSCAWCHEGRLWTAVAGPGLGHLVLPILGRPHVSTSHTEGNEGTCGSVLSLFLRGCCDSPQTAQPLPFQPGDVSKGFCLEQGWSVSSAGWDPRAQGALHSLGHLNSWGGCSAAPAQPVGIKPGATEHPCARAGSWDCPTLILLPPWPRPALPLCKGVFQQVGSRLCEYPVCSTFPQARFGTLWKLRHH